MALTQNKMILIVKAHSISYNIYLTINHIIIVHHQTKNKKQNTLPTEMYLFQIQPKTEMDHERNCGKYIKLNPLKMNVIECFI